MNLFQFSQPTLRDRVWSLFESPQPTRLQRLWRLFQSPQPSFLGRVWLSVRYPFDLFKTLSDAFLAVPALSFLLIPTFSSYSTSLNLLFFYLTWSTLILSHSPLKVEIIGTLVVRVLFYLLPSLGFLFFDSALPSLAANIKAHGDSALPLSNKNHGRKMLWWKIVLVSIGNLLFGLAIQTGVELLFTEVFQIRSALKVTTAIPMPWGIAKDLLRGLLLREALTYVLHRYVLHAPSSSLHELHSSWQHCVSPPYSFVANYDHPLPYIIHIFLPAYIPALFFRFHILTYYVYLAIVSVEETFAYSGYNVLPSALILGGIARRQEQHLMGDGKGNYGCFGLADLMMGTSLEDDILDDIQDEVHEKKKVAKGKTRATVARRSKS